MEESNKGTRRFLIIYCLAIFVFAVALILIASFSQMRANREAAEIQERLNSAEILAADKNTRLDAAMTENQRLSNQIKTLETQNATLTAQNAELSKKLTAYQEFAEIVRLDSARKKNQLKIAIIDFETAGYPELLSAEDLKTYNSIK